MSKGTKTTQEKEELGLYDHIFPGIGPDGDPNDTLDLDLVSDEDEPGEDEEDDIKDDSKSKTSKTDTTSKTKKKDDKDDESNKFESSLFNFKNDKNDENEDVEENELEDDEESEQVTAFFEAIAESAGWELSDEDDKPKTTGELIEYFNKVIEENSKPDYASKDVEELDNFVRNGGKIQEFFDIKAREIDYENYDISSEYNQRVIITEFLEEKGFSKSQIEKKLSKYDSAGLLEDEAEDALEALKDIREQQKAELIESQKQAKKEFDKQQRDFYAGVVKQIEDLTDIKGIKISKQDKKELLDSIFKVESDGKTKYQKEYAKNMAKNLIESAYFTIKGDTLISSAKKSGESDAVSKFRNSLTNTKTKGSKSKVSGDKPTPIWSLI